MGYARPTKHLHEMTAAERSDHYAHCEREVRKVVVDDKVAELERPISFKGCGHWQKPVLMVVQHAAGLNSITVSHDGKLDGAWRLPLTYSRSARQGQPIVRILHTEVAFQPMPLELGFLLIQVPGWLASKQELCQARLPRLCPEIEWSDSQKDAWDRLKREFLAIRDSQHRTQTKKYRNQQYGAERASRNKAGYFTVSDLASGRSKL